MRIFILSGLITLNFTYLVFFEHKLVFYNISVESGNLYYICLSYGADHLIKCKRAFDLFYTHELLL